MANAEFLRVLSCRLAFFRRNFQHYRGINVQSGKSDVFYSALWHRLSRGGRIWQPYRGLAHVGRSGPQTVRPGEKVDGEIVYFRSEGCAVPEREAASVFEPANTIEEVGHRIA